MGVVVVVFKMRSIWKKGQNRLIIYRSNRVDSLVLDKS